MKLSHLMILGKAKTFALRRSPELLLVAGLSGIVGALYLSGKASLKVEKLKSESSTVKKTDILRIYAPTISLTMLSFSCILASYGVMRKRNLALTAACSALSEAKNLQENSEDHAVTDISENPPVHPMALGHDVHKFSLDSSHPDWSTNAEVNEWYIAGKQDFLNAQLRRQGHLFLNEAFDAFSVNRTRSGATEGWVYNKNNRLVVDYTTYLDSDHQRCYEIVLHTQGSILDILE